MLGPVTRSKSRENKSESELQESTNKTPEKVSTISRRQSGNFGKQIPKTPKKTPDLNPEESDPENEDQEVFENFTPLVSPTSSKFSTPLGTSSNFLNQTLHNIELPYSSSNSSSSTSLNETQDNTPIKIQEIQKSTKMEYEKKDTIPELVQRRIPIFHGDDDSESVKYFLYQLQQVENACNEDASLITHALDECKAKLRGNAFNHMQNTDIKTFKEFRDFIRENFLPKFTIDEIKAKLTNANQKEGESISNFAKRINSLRNDYAKGHNEKYGVALNAAIIDEEEKKAFVHGLRSKTAKLTLSGQINQPMKDLVNGAKAIEETERLQSKGQHCQICQEIGHTGLSCPKYRNLVNIPQLPKHPQIFRCVKCLVNEHSTYECPQIRRCEYCSKTNHNIEECLKRKADFSNTIKCSFCQKLGHNVSVCRARLAQPFTSNAPENTFLNYRNPQNTFVPKFCSFHNMRGHSTEECRRKKELESTPNIPNQNPYQNQNSNTQNNMHTNNNFHNTQLNQQQTRQQDYRNNYSNTQPQNRQQNNQQNNYQYQNYRDPQRSRAPYNNNNNNQSAYNNRPQQQTNNQNRTNQNNTNTDDLANRFGNMQIHYMDGIDDIVEAPENYNGSYE